MHNKALLGGLIGFVLGGLVVSIAAVTFDKSANQSMQDTTNALAGKKGEAYDKAFLAAMIDHHQSALDMAKLSADRAQHDDVKKLSETIQTTQAQEIAQMKAWQHAWGYMNMSTDGTMQH